MASFKITGGKHLSGDLVIQGAKNEALQVICATILSKEKVTIHNIPNIRDVNNLISLMEFLGCKVKKEDSNSYSFQCDDIDVDKMYTEECRQKTRSLRGSVMLIGPMLARFHKAHIPTPGGDKIGRRRLDTHFNSFEKLGARVSYNFETMSYEVEGKNLKGTYMLLDEASITGTANAIMASVFAEGKTQIFNAACEPYLYQLCSMLNRMGAKISGVGSNLLTIEGVSELKGTEHTLLPDMIEVGSFIGLSAMTRSNIRLKNVHWQHLGIIPEIFSRLGIKIEKENDDMLIPPQEIYEIEKFMDGSIMHISDAPWPGFTPDLISIALVVSTMAKGSVLIHQKMFESRLFFVDKLIDMGAKIILCDPHRATVIGNERKYPLRGIRMSSPDIRAGVALLIAALSAEGTSIIDNIEQIDRGYQNIDTRLNNIGAEIERIN
ncbi:MAG: UDP-N-acetylglucosamine 1-carboxyvinyltransferase [Bacteroidales bacterium]|nr:UDP-N-acetylglucosamine 1-carboxyvinyltransferase [Bacteroidales bacterium]MDY6380983.1 UDP-N-acetylglucosamine 1-carboxyvinyltransferase [Bacteroidales bacterium]MDY6394434.1 UDP-N-acetylglucosamine 1-carboxyvinyltransferase [Bacteroidales bacterium]MDY6424428.1 UDP-N-acetylglucosamine 1-carboxyvinyltransferase [Bacteroidales bacterium]MEE3413417.1 UDP-N-acetylglucosamine 1-carboxyvinyltransferase [Bacteroidales bacterium]